MPFESQGGTPGGLPESPGGFQFGLQGWNWPEPVPRGITFFLDNTAKVTDQFGRAIKGAIIDGKPVMFAIQAPDADKDGKIVPRPQYATHQQVVAALEHERVDWRTLVRAGWPQLPYDSLKDVQDLPSMPPGEDGLPELVKIRDKALRRDALRLWKERRELVEKELQEEGLELPEQV